MRVPHQQLVKLPWSMAFSLANAGLVAFNINNLHQPYAASTHQPRAWDQWKAIYDVYTVLGATVKIELLRCASPVAGAELVTYLDDDATADNITPGALFESGHPHKRSLIDSVNMGAGGTSQTITTSGDITNNTSATATTSTSGSISAAGGGGASRMNGTKVHYWKFSAKKFFKPVKGQMIKSRMNIPVETGDSIVVGNYSALVDDAPSKKAYLKVQNSVGVGAGASNGTTMYCRCSIVFLALLTNPKELSAS